MLEIHTLFILYPGPELRNLVQMVWCMLKFGFQKIQEPSKKATAQHSTYRITDWQLWEFNGIVYLIFIFIYIFFCKYSYLFIYGNFFQNLYLFFSNEYVILFSQESFQFSQKILFYIFLFSLNILTENDTFNCDK